ncbi:MAG: hypothetical protein ABIS38_05570 [Sphingomicrobium sp.]
MRSILCVAAVLALVGCSEAEAPAANDSADVTTTAAPAAIPAAFDINSTSWEFIDAKSKKPIQESVDATGKYIAVSGTEHMDHGTAVMKDGKACFTSAMTKDGEICWTDPKIEVGQSGETTSDKGEKLPLKRVAYVPLTM